MKTHRKPIIHQVFFGNKNYKDNKAGFKRKPIPNPGVWSLLQQGMGTTKNPVILDRGSLDVLHCEFRTLRCIIFTYTCLYIHTYVSINIYILCICEKHTQTYCTKAANPAKRSTALQNKKRMTHAVPQLNPIIFNFQQNIETA